MRYFFFIIILLLPLISMAQLTAPGTSAVRYTSYPSNLLIKDPIFIYCNASGTQKGSLNASCPKGTGPFNYSWYKWNDITKNFDIFLNTEPAVMISASENLDEGGYKVVITGGYDTSLVGWIIFDQKPITEAKLTNPMKSCYYVALTGKAQAVIEKFYYHDPVTGVQLELHNELTFLWSSTPSSTIPNPNTEINPVTYTPPLEDVTYNLKVNTLGCSNDSSFFYQSIHVKADYSIEPDKGEAPLEVNFTDKSIRALDYKWDFGDGTTSLNTIPGSHIYYRPGIYYPKLTVESSLTCIDSARIDSVFVEPSKIEIPNVFTPDGDGINDFFIVESKSLRTINVEIFSRSGLMVYSFYGEGERLKDWQGWDGNVNRSSAKASPGVYFYIIRARGWDDKIYDSKEQRGFLYLYR